NCAEAMPRTCRSSVRCGFAFRTARQASCQGSCGSRSARTAPVSIRTPRCIALLASAFLHQSAADHLSYALPRVGTLPQGHRADHLRNFCVQAPLLRLVVLVEPRRAQPGAGNAFQKTADAGFLGARSLLEAPLQIGIETPAVDLGLGHALQCSATRMRTLKPGASGCRRPGAHELAGDGSVSASQP